MLALALLLVAAASTQQAAAVDFQSFAAWVTGCSSMNSTVCTSSLALTLNYVYSQVQEEVRGRRVPNIFLSAAMSRCLELKGVLWLPCRTGHPMQAR